MTTSQIAPAAAPDLPQAARLPSKGQRHGTIAAALRRMIVDGALPPGSRILEQKLSERLGVSRTPLREALKTLATEGLVELLPNRSAVVARFDLDEIAATMDVVATLEARAAILACTAATDAEIAGIAALHDAMLEHHSRGEFDAYFATNQAIHRAVVQASGNAVLLGLWDMLASRVQRAKLLPHRSAGRWAEAVSDHEAMIAALSARDGARLAGLMVHHLERGTALIRLQMAEVQSPQGDRSIAPQHP